MKKLLTYTLFSLAFVFFFSSRASADLIPPNSHSVSRCVKVVNLNEFTDTVLIGYITGAMIDKYEAYQINNNECLTKGYKFNSLSIYWTTKEKFNSIDLKNLKLTDINLLLENIKPLGGYVSDNNPLVKEDIEYSIAGFSNGKLIFYKSKQTSEYNNGSQKKVETFDSPQIQNPQSNKITSKPSEQPIIPVPAPELVRRGFWQSITCFFSGLFGRGCQ